MFEFLVIAAGAGFFIYLIFGISTFTSGKSFDDYKSRNPDCVKNGKVTCKNCGANDMFLRVAGGGPGVVLNSHVCRQCGTELYRSKT